MLFFFGALPIDRLKIKHTKKLKEIPSRHFLENLPEKARIYAFKHLKNLESGIWKIWLNDNFEHFSPQPWYMRVCGKLPKVIIIQQKVALPEKNISFSSELLDQKSKKS